MTHPSVSEGDLLAFLEGERPPHVVQALRESAALRAELSALRDLDAMLYATFGGLEKPDPQDLVDVVTGQASKDQRQRVEAYVRQSPAGRAELAALEQEKRDAEAAEGAAPIPEALPRYQALPQIRLGVGIRRALSQDVFYAEEVNIAVTLTMTLEKERWQLSGSVEQQQQRVAELEVILKQVGSKRTRTQRTNSAGEFDFTKLPSGMYRLELMLPDAIVVLPDLPLEDDDDKP